MSKYSFLLGAKVEGLKYTDNDLNLIDEAFSKHGYTATRPIGEKYEILKQFEDLRKKCTQSDTFVFYFSGHGFVDGGNLILKYHDDTQIDMAIIFAELKRCYARNKLIILDTCCSGNASNNWAPRIDEDNFCLLTATKQFKPAKELDLYQASFLSYHIHKALTQDYPINKNKQITIRTLTEYLEVAEEKYNLNDNISKIEKPFLYGGSNNIEISRIDDAVLSSSPKKIYNDNIKNICFISSEYPPNIVGGLGIHVNELTSALADQNFKTEIVYPYFNNCETNQCESTNIHLSQLTSNAQAYYADPYSWLRFAFHAYKKISENDIKPDVIHCHDWVTVLAGIALRWEYKIPLVFHIHLPNKRDFCSSIENMGIICADLITVNSNYIKDEINNKFSRENLRIQVVPNGINPNSFKPSSIWPEFETKNGFGDYILYVGRLVAQKGLEYLLRAFYFVNQKFPNMELRIVGVGEQEDALRQLTVNFMINDKVKFDGFKKDKELLDLYQNARLVVVPSIHEPFGMTAIEAMACKRPVVASNIMGLSENITHGKNGYLFESEDYLDCAQWIMTLLSNSNLNNQMGLEGYNYVNDNKLYWSRIAEIYSVLYNNIHSSNMDFSIKPIIFEFKEQICRLAEENACRSGSKDDYLITLFNWIK